MKKILDLLSEEMGLAFEAAGYAASLGRVTISNRPDLCEYQCNGAMAGAKQYRKAPIMIANEVAAKLTESKVFSEAKAVAPGFLNLKISEQYLLDVVCEMAADEKFGLEMPASPKKIIVDYGGANVAKPLHVGHIRSAVIGESIKRICRYAGHEVIGDVHLGDWGLQMGLIIAELHERQPDLPYFDPDFTGEYPAESPFTLSELEEIYPTASSKKSDPVFAEKAHIATYELQQGRRGYRAIWDHIMGVSLPDLKRIYGILNVDFEKWLGESDADPYIPAMVADLKERGLAVLSEGAWVIPVAEETDKKEVPPMILIKSDGSAIYATTDLATMVQRMQDWNPDKMLYVTDKRQGLHFEQVFRAAKKSGIVKPETELEHVGHGTMNGADGKPFKTRDGGVLRLEQLIADMTDFVRSKVVENKIVAESEVESTTAKIALAALKYGDLSNQPTKDYNFDLERFAAFEGNTGPYILYTIVRIKSILSRYGTWENLPIQPSVNAEGKDLMLTITKFGPTMESALKASAPNMICAYIYELAGCVNKFYHETPILKEEDEEKKAGYIALLGLAKNILEQCIQILGFEAPEKM
jgi:arginyl-tRNA synthetase